MATVTGLTAARMLEIEANAIKAISTIVNKAILAVPSLTGVTGTISLGRAYRLDKLVVNRPCRVRLYISAAHRTADADRPRDEDPVGDHGCIAEIIMTAELLSASLIPIPHGYVVSGTTYFTVFNDGPTGDINLTFTEHILEA